MAIATHGRRDKTEKRFAGFRKAERAVWDRFGISAAEEYVDVGDGVRLRVHTVGDGDPILFVHGSGGSGVYWAPLVAELAANYRCVLVDRPGWTRSSPVDYSEPDFATVAVRLLDGLRTALDLDLVHLVGGSIGEMFALRYAIRRPAGVQSLVLLGSGPNVEEVTPPTPIRLLRSPFGRIMARLPQRAPMIRQQLKGLGHSASLEEGRQLDGLVRMYEATSRYTDAMHHERSLVRAVLNAGGWEDGFPLDQDDLAKIPAPTLMVLGSQDPIGSTELWQRFVDALPDARLEIIPDGGHLPWWDDPVGVADMVRAHLGAG